MPQIKTPRIFRTVLQINRYIPFFDPLDRKPEWSLDLVKMRKKNAGVRFFCSSLEFKFVQKKLGLREATMQTFVQETQAIIGRAKEVHALEKTLTLESVELVAQLERRKAAHMCGLPMHRFAEYMEQKRNQFASLRPQSN